MNRAPSPSAPRFPKQRKTSTTTRRSIGGITPHTAVLALCILLFTGSSTYLVFLARSQHSHIEQHHRSHRRSLVRSTISVDASDLDQAIDSAYRAASGQTKFAADQRRQGVHAEHAHLAIAAEQKPVLVSYAYVQKDNIQKANAEFFSILGMGLDSSFPAPVNTEFVMVISGRECEPCSALLRDVEAEPAPVQAPYDQVKHTPFLTLIWRFENVGMDIASHNVTLEWAAASKRLAKYAYFIFLGSSARGPFVPNYLPAGWRWPDAFTRLLVGDVKGVSAAISCLPEEDAGGPGPRMESFAFALDVKGLQTVVSAGAFARPTCTQCDVGMVMAGEYLISKALLDSNYNIATLLSMYNTDTDWRDPKTWSCNNNVHASRHGSYDGIDMHPFETLFVKSSWHVGEPFVARYSRWYMKRALSRPTTQGIKDMKKHRYFMSTPAIQRQDMSSCYPFMRGWGRS